jgi:hypothetical protein
MLPQTSAVFTPASCSFKIPMICSSVYPLVFIPVLPFRLRENACFHSLSFSGAGQRLSSFFIRLSSRFLRRRVIGGCCCATIQSTRRRLEPRQRTIFPRSLITLHQPSIQCHIRTRPRTEVSERDSRPMPQ